MSETIINGLVKRKEEITTERKRIQLQLKAMAADIEHINATIRIFSPDYQAVSQRVKTERGSISRKLFDILRESDKPMTSKEIAIEMVGADSDELRVMVKRIGVTLCNYRKKGKVKSSMGENNANLWQIA
ncbi:hypothetical protein N9W34_05385 [Rickettsiales bacterium]|nr:hypothetical protein [Rickettsiales bacterium]